MRLHLTLSRLRHTSTLLAASLFLLNSCDDGTLADGLPADINCTSCHGSQDNAAPPKSPDGATETNDPRVGAHQAHLTAGTLRAPLACDDCHIVPETLEDEGHVDYSPAEITWGPLATTGGQSPAWDRENATCASTYCHGTTMSGGEHTIPLWTKVDGSQITCDSCHGFPPPSPHPQSEACHACHGDTVDAAGELDVEGGLHINGSLQLGQ